MYQHVSRKASFDFIRKRFPELLAVYRFFYRVGATIWFGGKTVPIVLTLPGRRHLRAPGRRLQPQRHSARSSAAARATAARPSCASGRTTRPSAESQRLHRTTDITGTADDTYACDACAPLPDGGTAQALRLLRRQAPHLQ